MTSMALPLQKITCLLHIATLPGKISLVMSSLRQKITLGYYAIGTLIVGLSLFTFLELRLIEEKILAGDRITEFFDTTLEIRRFEKNYFLYRQAADYEEAVAYVRKAGELLRQNLADFSVLAAQERVIALERELESYRRLMGEYAQTKDDVRRADVLEGRIRKAGKGIVTVAEEIARAERKMLQASLDRHRKILILSIAGLIVLVVVVGQILSRMVARPLKRIEESMEAVANGKLDKIDIGSGDREIASLTTAFNHVLKELEVRQKHLVRSEKLASLGTLLSGVAHELNNPLSNISSSCQILAEELEDADPEYKKELLAQIDDQTNRARNIVRSLLDFARDKEFKREPLPLGRLFAETLRFIKGQTPAQVEIKTDIPGDIVIAGDKQRLQQAFLNLLKNAIEAVEGAGEIRVRAARRRANDKDAAAPFTFLGQCSPGDEVAEIEIRDSGHGIPPELLPRIFDPFFTTKEVGKGSGLGLFIVYEIIEEHGGCIAVDSKPGEGTAFFIRLPLPEAGRAPAA